MTDREKVIRGLECCTNPSPSYCRKCPYKGTPDDYPHCVHDRLQADTLALLKEQEPVGGWISVKDKLPDLEEQVLIVYEWTGRSGEKYREIALDSFKAMRFLGYKPLLWMPLPEPPKEEM